MIGKRTNEDWVKEKLFTSCNIYFGAVFMSESPQQLLGCRLDVWEAGNEAVSAWNCCSHQAMPPGATAPQARLFSWGWEVWLIIFLVLQKWLKAPYTTPAPVQNQSSCFVHGVLSLEVDFMLKWQKATKDGAEGFFRPLFEDCSLVLHLAASSETWASVLYFCNPKPTAGLNLHWNSYGGI